MSSINCPKCNSNFVTDIHSFDSSGLWFKNQTLNNIISNAQYSAGTDQGFETCIYNCPNCSYTWVTLRGLIGSQKDNFVTLGDTFVPLPNYVPESIRNDYHEAYSIKDLSPKASATLSRRTLQGMIRDFFGISKNRLIDEIDAITPNVTAEVKDALNGLRSIGNIGAHPEKNINIILDIEPGEAETLLKFIEYLVNSWYTERQNTSLLLSEVKQIANNKSEDKKTN